MENSIGRKVSALSLMGGPQLDSVVKYIENQEQHHSKKTFKEEYLSLLKRFKIDYDDRYLFEWVEAW